MGQRRMGSEVCDEAVVNGGPALGEAGAGGKMRHDDLGTCGTGVAVGMRGSGEMLFGMISVRFLLLLFLSAPRVVCGVCFFWTLVGRR